MMEVLYNETEHVDKECAYSLFCYNNIYNYDNETSRYIGIKFEKDVVRERFDTYEYDEDDDDDDFINDYDELLTPEEIEAYTKEKNLNIKNPSLENSRDIFDSNTMHSQPLAGTSLASTSNAIAANHYNHYDDNSLMSTNSSSSLNMSMAGPKASKRPNEYGRNETNLKKMKLDFSNSISNVIK